MIILKPSIVIDKSWRQSLRILRRERWQRKSERYFETHQRHLRLVKDRGPSRRDFLRGAAAAAAVVAAPRPAAALMRGGFTTGGGFMACGQLFPNASTTGARGTLTPMSGDIVTTSNGQIFKDIALNGGFIVHHPNVSFINCNIQNGTSASAYGIDNNNTSGQQTGMIVDRCTIQHGDYGIFGPATVTNCDISIVENGWLPVDNGKGIGNYIHDMFNTGSDPHYDCIECNAGDTNEIAGNTLINQVNQTSCVQMNNDFGACVNQNIHNNYMSGGGFPFYWASFNNTPMTGGVFDNNVLGNWPGGGFGGPWDLDQNGNPNWVAPENHGNVQFDSTPTACAAIGF